MGLGCDIGRTAAIVAPAFSELGTSTGLVTGSGGQVDGYTEFGSNVFADFIQFDDVSGGLRIE
jgi:hypothetical protein